MGLFGSGGGLLGLGGASKFDRSKKAEELYGGVDPDAKLGRIADWSSAMGTGGYKRYEKAGDAIGRQNTAMGGLSDQYGQLSGQYGRQYGQLADQYGRIAGGQNSISAEQLRQGLQQNLAGQRSMAAGAAPQNAAMAARTAMMQGGQLGAGLAGQQAMAGLQERRDALAGQMGALGGGAQAQQGFMGGQSNLQNAIQQGMIQGRGQDVQMALGGQQGALQGYGNIEAQRTARYNALMGQPAPGEQMLGAVTGATTLAALSDRRAKKDIKPGDRDAERLLKGLRAYSFKYKQRENGEGKQLGVMAQSLEKLGLKQAVVDTPGGKIVHGAKLATAIAATLPVINKRLERLERR